MKSAAKSRTLILVVVPCAVLLVAFGFYHSYRVARRVAARDAERFSDCNYTGTRLSYSQIYAPPKFLRLPHWEVTYDSTNANHRFTRIVTLSEAR